MHCPYCTSEISAAALVCPVCTRDLYLFKPLLQKIDGLEKQLQATRSDEVEALSSRVAALEKEVEILRTAPVAVAAPHNADHATAAAGVAAATTSAAHGGDQERHYAASALIAFGISLILLLAAHGLIVMVYDLKPLYLRIASLLIPLPFGVALYVWHPRRFWISVLLASITACIAVIGMSAVTGYTDNVPVMPQNLRDWREFIEYAASIAFSAMTGLLLGKLRAVRANTRREPSRVILFVARLFTAHEDGELGLQKMIARITKLVATLTPAASAAVSVYTGVKAFVGDS